MVKGQKVGPRKLVQFKIGLTEADALALAEDAEEAGIRTKGQKLILAKEHGFAGQKTYNTKGLAKFLWHAYKSAWKAHKLAQELERRRLAEEAAKHGYVLQPK